MDGRYKKMFLNHASQLDDMAERHGEIYEYAKTVAEEADETATKALWKEILKITDGENATKEIKEKSNLLENSLYVFYGYAKIHDACKPEQIKEDTRTLDDILKELNALIGLEKVKNKVNDLIAYHKVQGLREKHGLSRVKTTLHLAFTGKPGTGKTTVARIVGQIYKRIGLLSKGHFLEVSRTDLIAGYQGQTALKVKKVIERAKGGVLFIDEAYSITENDHSDAYGRECLTELTKALEDYRDDLVVVVAGYTEPMNDFFESNPGLKSRFNTFIEFDDYTADELEKILAKMCKDDDYSLSEEVKCRIKEYLVEQTAEKGEYFANGRLVRNLFDDIVMNHAKRVVGIKEPSKEELTIVTIEDILKQVRKIS